MPKNNRNRDEQYFATLEPYSAEFAKACLDRFKAHEEALKATHRHERMRRSWAMAYSIDKDGGWDNTEIAFAGQQGEVTLIKPNLFRNLLQHQLNLVTQTPPAYECEAVNSDSEALAQARLGNGILGYYHKVHHLDDLRVERAEVALVFGESFLVAPWDHNKGKAVGVKDEPVTDDDGNEVMEDVPVMGPDGAPVLGEDGQTAVTEQRPKVEQKPVYEGEYRFAVYTPYECAYDPHAPDKRKPPWSIVKEPVNRWDMIAEFPDMEEELRDAPPYSETTADWKFDNAKYNHDDYIAVYRVTVEKSPACPDGRHARVLNEDDVLLDGPLVEDRSCVFRLAASDVIKQPGGYSNNFDVMPIQEARQAQVSTILSNHDSFGGQLVAAPKGSNVKPHHLGKHRTLIEYDAVQGIPPPAPLNLVATPPEMFTFLDWLTKEAEQIGGVPPVMRGQSEKGASGAKEALLHATAQQYASGFMRNLGRSDEDVATYLITTLSMHATTPRVASIAGRFNASASREYDGGDLKQITRVVVRQANPGLDTFEGRLLMADKLMGMPNGIVTAEQYITFLTTGRVDPMYERTLEQITLIQRENDLLREPGDKPLRVVPTDQHALHIQEHACVLDDPAVRFDEQLVARVKQHLEEHAGALTPGHPFFAGIGLLLATNQQPFPAPQPMPGMAPGQGPANDNGKPQEQDKPPQKPGEKPNVSGSGGPNMPMMPKNPVTGKRVDQPVPERPAVAG